MLAERPFDGVKKTGSDPLVEEQILEHSRRYGIDALDAVKMFPVLVRRQWLKRFLAHVELFKLTLDVPGDIAELGVFRGAGLFTWANSSSPTASATVPRLCMDSIIGADSLIWPRKTESNCPRFTKSRAAFPRIVSWKS